MAETIGARKGGDGDQNWCTPRSVLDIIEAFAPIDLDPCSNSYSRVNAGKAVALPDDGLTVPWHAYSHTFVNPPYGRGQIELWAGKAAKEHAKAAKHITMLITASPETGPWKRYVWGSASAIGFWNHRIAFERDGESSGNQLPSALIYWGHDPQRFGWHLRDHATIVTDWTGKL